MMRQSSLLLLVSTLLLAACGNPPVASPSTLEAVTIDVPQELQGKLTVQGADGVLYSVDASGRLTLPPGTYTVVGEPYKQDGYTYAAPPLTLVVTAGETPSLAVMYAPITGALVVTVSAEGNATVEATGATRVRALAEAPVTAVTVSGPGGYRNTLSGSGTYKLEDLTPGAYTLSGPNGQATQVNVSAGQTAAAGGVTLSGAAQLAYVGLPAGAKPTLRLQNAKNAVFRIPTDNLVMDLTPGSYTLKSMVDVKSGGLTYHAEPVTFTVSVGETGTPALSFAPIDARLTVTVAGAVGLTPSATLSGPGGFSQDFTQAGELTLEYLAPGAYALSAPAVSDGTYQYAPVLTAETLTLTAGQSAQVGLSYAVSTGNVAASATGLPEGASATLSLQPVGGAPSVLPASGELRDLAPGQYLLTGAQLTAGGMHYLATPVELTVVAGHTATPTLSFAAIDGRMTLTVHASDVVPSVTLSGPGGFSQTVSQAGDHTFEHLAPGAYVLTAANRDNGTYLYAVAESPLSVSVTAGQTLTPALTYAPVTGMLDLSLVGAPSGSKVALAGPQGQSLEAQDGSTLEDLVPGVYSLTTTELLDSGWKYVPAPGASASVTAGQRATLRVGFSRVDVGAPTEVELHSDASELDSGTTIPLTAFGRDNDAVASFELYEGTQKLGTQQAVQAIAGYSAAFGVSGASDGAHTYSVVAVDAAGLRQASAPLTVTLRPPAAPNNAPVIAAIEDEVLVPGRTVTLAASSSFSDADGDALSVSAESDAPHVATASVQGDGSVSVTSVDLGTAHLTVRVSDGKGGSAERTFSVTVGAPTMYFSEYLSAGPGQVALELYYAGPDAQATGYLLEVHQWVSATSQMRVSNYPLFDSSAGMVYLFIDTTFYDFFDVTSAWYYNDEVPFTGSGVTTTALVLEKNGQVVDVLGDPSESARTPILPQGGTLVRKAGVGLGRDHYVAREWTSYPSGTFQFIGGHTP